MIHTRAEAFSESFEFQIRFRRAIVNDYYLHTCCISCGELHNLPQHLPYHSEQLTAAAGCLTGYGRDSNQQVWSFWQRFILDERSKLQVIISSIAIHCVLEYHRRKELQRLRYRVALLICPACPLEPVRLAPC
jgi:hypothetical protein